MSKAGEAFQAGVKAAEEWMFWRSCKRIAVMLGTMVALTFLVVLWTSIWYGIAVAVLEPMLGPEGSAALASWCWAVIPFVVVMYEVSKS